MPGGNGHGRGAAQRYTATIRFSVPGDDPALLWDAVEPLLALFATLRERGMDPKATLVGDGDA